MSSQSAPTHGKFQSHSRALPSGRTRMLSSRTSVCTRVDPAQTSLEAGGERGRLLEVLVEVGQVRPRSCARGPSSRGSRRSPRRTSGAPARAGGGVSSVDHGLEHVQGGVQLGLPPRPSRGVGHRRTRSPAPTSRRRRWSPAQAGAGRLGRQRRPACGPPRGTPRRTSAAPSSTPPSRSAGCRPRTRSTDANPGVNPLFCEVAETTGEPHRSAIAARIVGGRCAHSRRRAVRPWGTGEGGTPPSSRQRAVRRPRGTGPAPGRRPTADAAAVRAARASDGGHVGVHLGEEPLTDRDADRGRVVEGRQPGGDRHRGEQRAARGPQGRVGGLGVQHPPDPRLVAHSGAPGHGDALLRACRRRARARRRSGRAAVGTSGRAGPPGGSPGRRTPRPSSASQASAAAGLEAADHAAEGGAAVVEQCGRGHDIDAREIRAADLPPRGGSSPPAQGRSARAVASDRSRMCPPARALPSWGEPAGASCCG